MKTLSLIVAVLVAGFCADAQASGYGQAVVQQNIVVRQRVRTPVFQQRIRQRISLRHNAAVVAPVYAAPVVAQVYAQPIAVQQYVAPVVVQPYVQKFRVQSFAAPGCGAASYVAPLQGGCVQGLCNMF